MAMDPFWSNIFKRPQTKEDAIFDLVQQVPVFRDLTRREFRQLERIFHRRRYAPGEMVVREGELGLGLYIIISGRVDILQRATERDSLVIAALGPGDFFGEQSLLDEMPRTASAQVVEACTAIGFFRPDLLDLVERNPRLGLKIVMQLSQIISVRLRHTNGLLKEARARMQAAGIEKASPSKTQELKAEVSTDPLSQNIDEA